MTSKRLVSTAVICLALAAGTTACGGDKDKTAATGPNAAAPSTAAPSPTPTVPALDTEKLTAEEIEKKAKDAMAAATSVHIKGQAAMDTGSMKIDLILDTKGQCTGTMAMGAVGSFEIISDGTKAWLKPDAAFWKSQAGPGGDKAAELFKGRYLTGDMSDREMKQMASFCNLAVFTKDLTDADGGKVTKGSAGTVNGLKTFSLNSVNKDGEKSLVHIATEGKPYPVRVENTGSEPGTIDFTDYDKPVQVTPPPADNVIDMNIFRKQFPAGA
ncbi:hypothetical protein ACWGB8_05305 [Kitasatospora sp. NPDC054939]